MLYKKDHKNKSKGKRKILHFGQSIELPKSNIEKRYLKTVPYNERIKLIEEICKKLIERYDAYEATKTFVEYLRMTNEVFEQAKREDFTIEQTQRALVEKEIILLSKETGVNKEIFEEIYKEYERMSLTSHKFSVVAQTLREKYKEHEYSGAIMFFINTLEKYYQIFSDAVEHELPMNRVAQRVAHAQISNIASRSDVPEKVLDEVYKEFLYMLVKAGS